MTTVTTVFLPRQSLHMLMLAGVSVKLTTVATDNSNRVNYGAWNYPLVLTDSTSHTDVYT